MTGYQPVNLASERIRALISLPCSIAAEPPLTSAVLLVLFATASQQISPWISCRSTTIESCKLFSSTTPSDTIITIQAILTISQTLYCDSSSLTRELSQELNLASETPAAEITIPQKQLWLHHALM